MRSNREQVSAKRFGQVSRLQFIDQELYWSGEITRRRIAETFGVSHDTAKADLRRYRLDLAPDLTPDDQDNVYRVPLDYEPRLGKSPDPEGYLGALTARQSVEIPVDVVPDIDRRPIDPTVLQSVIRCIKASQELLVYYRSARSREARPVWIYPHALTHDGFRWAARCYVHRDEEHGYWGDIVLDRIEDVTIDTRPASKELMGKDESWNAIVEIEIIPNPGLDAHECGLIEEQYGMIGGRKIVRVRQCQLVYFLKRYQLEEPITLKAPHQAPIVLRDRDMANELVPVAMQVPLSDHPGGTASYMRALRKRLPDLTEQEILEEALRIFLDQ
ncbi:hypothetical protein [Emcibacter sp. SYSU 3D8]|uniref:hypothetical protein n=1 Tax=Emcibacter sp. SYSU 3D8 TaxID=3133969 RepID=UPI0031FF197E